MQFEHKKEKKKIWEKSLSWNLLISKLFAFVDEKEKVIKVNLICSFYTSKQLPLIQKMKYILTLNLTMFYLGFSFWMQSKISSKF